jgi:Sulfotransferase domain
MSCSVGLCYFSPDDILFSEGVTYRPSRIGRVFRETGYCYGGFRIFPCYPVPILTTSKVILLVRDPRDILVSLYFSVRGSHVMPPADTKLAKVLSYHRDQATRQPIDRWVLENYGLVMAAFEGYLANGFTQKENVKIYRYEDIIFRKASWALDIADWYGWSFTRDAIEEIVTQFNITPVKERPDEHTRQVHPGNFRYKLSPETRSDVTDIFRQYLDVFDYGP